MIHTMIRRAFLAAILVAVSNAAHAQELRLDCTMTDYSGLIGGNFNTSERAALSIRSLIPEHAIHVIDGESTWIEGTEFYGSYNRDGRQRRMEYSTRVPVIGEARITYTYILSSGQITASALFPKNNSYRRIDRITGTCKRRG